MEDASKPPLRLRRAQGDGASSFHDPGHGSAGAMAAAGAEFAIERGITPKELLDSYYGDANPETISKCQDLLSRSMIVCPLLEVAAYYSRDGQRPKAALPRNVSEGAIRFIEELHELVVEKKGHTSGEELGPHRRLIGSFHPRARGRSDDPDGREP